MFTIKEILKATDGQLIQGSLKRDARGVSIDSRQIKADDLFVAIKGENFDGHDFLNDVIAKSASAVVVSKVKKFKNSDVPVILVKDTIKALGQLAHMHRMRFDIPLIAITGSAGKTTTKEMVAAVLSRKYKVLKNVGTHNNHIGVPMTLFQLNSSHEAAVLECGTNQPGDIPWLGYVVQPTVAVLTNIGASHLEKLKNPSGVFREKITLAKHLSKTGTIIFNNDDAHLQRITRRNLLQRRLTFGLNNKADYQARDIRAAGHHCLNFCVGPHRLTLPSLGRDNIYNALAATSCGRLLNVSYKDIAVSLKNFRFPKGRQVYQKIGSTWLIDDTYNANPVSMHSAIAVLHDFSTKGRRILICADMLELGKETERLHKKIGVLVGQSNIECLVTVGNYARLIARAVPQKNKKIEIHEFATQENLLGKLSRICQTGDVILVKGSRRMKMEKTIEFLTNHFKE